MISRRALTTGSLGLAGLVLAGCNSSDGSSSDASSAGGSAQPGFPAKVETKFGTVTVPASPKRVVALGWGDAETALALGVQPVGQSDWLAFGGDGVGPWANGKYTTAPTKIETLKPSYEKIAALKPDLILDVKSSGDAERYKRLSSIAPTIGVPEGGDSYLTAMQQQVTMIAAALGKSAQGKALLSGIDQKFAAARKANPSFAGKTVTVGSYTSEGWGAYIAKSERVEFMKRLGFTPSPKIEALKPDGFSVKISREKLIDLDADLLVIFPIYKPASEVTTQALFKQIPAVKEGHVVVFDDKDDAVRQAYAANTVLSVPFALQKAVPMFAAALK